MTSDQRLVNKAADGKHCQTPVLNLGQLIFGLFRRVLRHSQWIKPKLTWHLPIGVHVLNSHLSLVEDGFEEPAESKYLEHRLRADHADGIHGVRGLVGRSRKMNYLADDETDDGEHRHAAVLQLRFPQIFDGEVFGYHEWVEFGVPHPSVELRRFGQKWDRFAHFGLHAEPAGVRDLGFDPQGCSREGVGRCEAGEGRDS
mmetsp:Transcript_13124/g.19603  ORF Transcript_13124/g.19603 Transcript_13124/m.19603 type:complete len:200 (+) Transcript_13124:84-683(+)